MDPRKPQTEAEDDGHDEFDDDFEPMVVEGEELFDDNGEVIVVS